MVCDGLDGRTLQRVKLVIYDKLRKILTVYKLFDPKTDNESIFCSRRTFWSHLILYSTVVPHDLF